MANISKSENSEIMVKVFRYALPVIVLIFLGVWFREVFDENFHQGNVEFQSAAVLQVPVPLPYVSLTDHNGEEFTRRNFSGKWTFMFFGYTHCPDVCPIALVDLDDIYSELADKGDLIEKQYKVGTQVVFVTVDPQRDDAEELKEYVPFFNKAFLGVTGRPEEIETLSRPLGVAYNRTSETGEDYLVDHSASFLLIDPLGRLRAIFSPPHDPRQIAEDFRSIRTIFTAECCISSSESN